MKLIRIGAAVGAIAMAASVGLGGMTLAQAAVSPVVTITNANADGVVPDGEVQASITGCSVADGAASYEVFLYSYDADGVSRLIASGPAPDTGAISVSAFTPLPGDYSVDIACYEYAGDDGTEEWTNFTSTQGYVDLAGPGGSDTWLTSDPVTLTSPTVGELTAFDPNSQVTIWVIGPDGTRFDLGTVAANAVGTLDTSMVLPFTVDGTYQVFAQGVKTTEQGTMEPVTVTILLYNEYSRVTPPAPADPPAAPAPAPAPRPGDKPTALPRTGGEGMGLVPAAALISVVAGGLAVALRSRKH